MKTCRGCNKLKPLDQYPNDKRAKDGKRSRCKACTNAANSAWNKANGDKVNAAARARRAADPEAARAKARLWLAANPGKGAEYSRRYRERHPEQAAASKRRYREQNAEWIKQLAAAWRDANRDKVRAIDANRRARQMLALVGEVDYLALRLEHPGCYLCGKPMGDDTHMDHIVPLSRGGAHCMGNLLPTHANCNRRKADLFLAELTWYTGATDLGVTLHPEVP